MRPARNPSDSDGHGDCAKKTGIPCDWTSLFGCHVRDDRADAGTEFVVGASAFGKLPGHLVRILAVVRVVARIDAGRQEPEGLIECQGRGVADATPEHHLTPR